MVLFSTQNKESCNENTGSYKVYANFAWRWAPASSKPIHINPLFIHACICMQQRCRARAWSVPRKASIISAAHVFEEVEVFLLSVKQDLLGLNFIADSFRVEVWKCPQFEVTHFSPVGLCCIFTTKNQQPGRLQAEYHHFMLWVFI